MDPITHAASGAVAFLALSKRPATLWSLPLAAIACASPDIDLIFIKTPLEFLQLHRGITHSFAGSLPLGFILAILCWPLWRKSTPDRWSFLKVWLFCIGMIWLHIWLDVVTTYGTMVFLPFSHYRVRLNAIYIIDVLITLPLLWAIWRWRTRKFLMLATFLWIFIYPAIGIFANLWHTKQWEQKLAEDPNISSNPVILPDAFAPLFWRVLYKTNSPEGQLIIDQPANVLGYPRGTKKSVSAAPADLIKLTSEDSIAGETFFNFTILPCIADVKKEDEPAPPLLNSSLFMFYDLRFGSGLEFVQELLAMRPNANIPFQFLVELTPKEDVSIPPEELKKIMIERIRLRFTDSGRDSHWHKPEKPIPPTLWQWLVGLQN